MTSTKEARSAEPPVQQNVITFSIVIPLYNKAAYITDTLSSVLSQEYKYFEVIIVDDGSTDGGADLVASEFTDTRIRIIRQENQGASAARNAGVSAARYEFIAFLDADDILLPEYLYKMQQMILDYPNAGMYCCGGVICHRDGTGTMRYSPKHGNKTGPINFFKYPYFFSNCSAVVIRHSGFRLAGGFPVGMKQNEDLVFFFKLALQVDVIFCPELLSIVKRGIEGQASADTSTYLKNSTLRSNLVIDLWDRLPERNPLFITWTKFELREYLLRALKARDSSAICEFISMADNRLLSQFCRVELFFYRQPRARPLSILFIYIFKFIWRINGFPRPTDYRCPVGLSSNELMADTTIRNQLIFGN